MIEIKNYGELMLEYSQYCESIGLNNMKGNEKREEMLYKKWISKESLIKNLKKKVQKYSLILAGIEDNQEVYSDDKLKTTKDINELRAIIDELEALIKYVQ